MHVALLFNLCILTIFYSFFDFSLSFPPHNPTQTRLKKIKNKRKQISQRKKKRERGRKKGGKKVFIRQFMAQSQRVRTTIPNKNGIFHAYPIMLSKLT